MSTSVTQMTFFLLNFLFIYKNIVCSDLKLTCEGKWRSYVKGKIVIDRDNLLTLANKAWIILENKLSVGIVLIGAWAIGTTAAILGGNQTFDNFIILLSGLAKSGYFL